MSTVDDLLAPAVTHPHDIDFERDKRWGHPLIVPPEGGRKVRYKRPSSAGKDLEYQGQLNEWRIRTTARGLLLRKDLFAQLAAIPLEHWDDKATKARIAAILDEAMEAAGSSVGRNLGTALHEMVKRRNRGEQFTPIAPFDADLAAYERAIAEAGVIIDPEYVERTLVCDELRMAGTTDAFVRWPARTDLLVVGDLKCGESIWDPPITYIVQLAIYANSVLYDVTTDQRTPLPIDRTVGLLFHLPAGQGRCAVYELDLTLGWEMAKTAVLVTDDYRKRKGLLKQVAAAVPPPAAAAASPAAPAAPPAAAAGDAETLKVESGAQHGAHAPVTLRPAAAGPRDGGRAGGSAGRTMQTPDTSPAAAITDQEWADAETAGERLKAMVEANPRAKASYDAALDGIRRRHPHSADVAADNVGATEWAHDQARAALSAAFPGATDVTVEFTTKLRADLVAAITAASEEQRTQIAAMWPLGVPRVSEADLAGLEQIKRVVEDVVGFIGANPTVTSAEELVDRLRRLPADLLAAVEATAKQQGVPNLRGGGVDTKHLMIVADLCERAEAEHAVRVKEVDEALEDLDVSTANLVVSTATDGRTLRRLELLELEAERVVALAAAVTWLTPVDPFAGLDGEGPALLDVDCRHWGDVVDRLGGKAAAVALAKTIAARHGRPAPRSADAITGDPVLTALVACG